LVIIYRLIIHATFRRFSDLHSIPGSSFAESRKLRSVTCSAHFIAIASIYWLCQHHWLWY